MARRFRHTAFFIGSNVREAVQEGRAVRVERETEKAGRFCLKHWSLKFRYVLNRLNFQPLDKFLVIAVIVFPLEIIRAAYRRLTEWQFSYQIETITKILIPDVTLWVRLSEGLGVTLCC